MSASPPELPEMGQPEYAQGRWVPPWRCGRAYLASIQAWTGIKIWRDDGNLPTCWRWRFHKGPHRDPEMGEL